MTRRSNSGEAPAGLPPTLLSRGEERDRWLTEVGGELLRSYEEVEADADYRPAVLRLRLDQDAGQLAALEPDVVGPLDHALAAGTEGRGGRADRERDGERQQQVALVQRAQDRRVEQRLALGRGPDTTLAPPPRGLFAGGDHGAARRAGLDQLPSAAVGRVGNAVVTVG